MIWNDKAIATAIQMNQEGYSASQIGRVLGCSRNSVIGKLHRMGYRKANPTKGASRSGAVRKTMGTGAKVAPLPELPPSNIHAEKLVPLLELNGHHCRWPIGDPTKDDFGFCGLKPEPGKSYCEGHARIGVVPTARTSTTSSRFWKHWSKTLR